MKTNRIRILILGILVIVIFELSTLKNIAQMFSSELTYPKIFARYRLIRELLFNTELVYQTDLEEKKISDGLRQEFVKNRHTLSQNIDISKGGVWVDRERFENWLIIDKNNEKIYDAVITGSGIDVYLCKNPFIPMDEADQNPDFKKFRDELIDAVKKKDLKYLLEHIEDTINYSWGGWSEGDTVIKGFIIFWKLGENPEKSEIWYELGEVLRLGGSFSDDKTSFTAPIFFARGDVPANTETYECSTIIGRNVNVRSKPSSKSKVITRLDYCVVRNSESKTGSETINGETYPWIEISTLDGVKGYVFGKYVRSIEDYRACFKKENGVWKMVFFIAGD